jgi:endonuclease/exonuclease/phosphatase family metal-dependent hydrolase
LLIGSLYLSTSAENRTLNLALAAALVFGYVVLPGAITGTSDTRFVLVGNELAALALVMVSHRSGEPGTRAGLWRTSTAWACGMLAFLVLTAVYYAGYDTVLPFENDVLFGIAAAVLFVAVLPGLRAAIRNVNPAMDWTPALVGVALIVFPLLVRSTTPRPIPGGDLPLRVMSYNIHMGFDAEGWLDLEAIAQTIESSEADVVALQEVPRGWYINASVDALDWLSRRLDMPYVFAGTADPVWGNAILSRYAIAGSGQSRLPEAGVRPRRGVVWITIDLPGPRDLVVIDTHLHHSSSPPRLEQIPRVIDVYASHADHYRVVLGDMNARPDSAELQLYRDAGLQDAYLLAGGDPASGFTIRSDRPRSRIDYILLSSDLKPGNFQIHASTASDHLGISVTIGK